MFYFGYGSYPVKVTHCKIGFLHMVRLYFLHLVRLYFLHLVRLYFLHLVRLTSYKQLFKTLTNSSRHAELFQYLIYICLHSLDVFLRKHFVRLRCKLTYSSCKRLFFSIRYFLRKYFVRSTNSPCLQRKSQLEQNRRQTLILNLN